MSQTLIQPHPTSGVRLSPVKIMGSGPRTGGGPGPANCSGVATGATMTDAGGLVLTEPNIYLIFWGTHWNASPTLSQTTVTNLLDRICRSSYLDSLWQYRQAGGGARIASTALVDAALDSTGTQTPASPSGSYQQNGATISAFATADIPNLVANAVLANLVPAPPSNGNAAYCVVLPENVYNSDTQGGFWGQHGFTQVTYLDSSGREAEMEIIWMWVTHAGVQDQLTSTFAHELAETCSDPGQLDNWAFGVKNWVPASASSGTGSEIGDICEGWSALLNGVVVQSYFSNSDQTCIVATFAWANLGTPIGGATACDVGACNNADGRIELFTVGENEQLSHIWQTAPNNGWSTWGSLGAPVNVALDYKKPAVGRNKDGRLEVFVCHGSSVAHIWQTAPNNGWSVWADLGAVNGIAGTAVVVNNADGRLEVFLLDNGGSIQHNWQTKPAAGPWSGWSSLAAPSARLSSQPCVGQNQDGRLEVFVQDTTGAVWHIWQTAPNSGWSSWSGLGAASPGLLQGLAIGSNSDGRLELFAAGADGALWHIYQSAPNSGWSGWESLGKPTIGLSVQGVLTVTGNADGRLQVFALDQYSRCWSIWQMAPSAGPWSDWRCYSGIAIDDGLALYPVTVLRNQDGRMEAFAVHLTDGGVWHNWQTAPNAQWALSNTTSGCK